MHTIKWNKTKRKWHVFETKFSLKEYTRLTRSTKT